MSLLNIADSNNDYNEINENTTDDDKLNIVFKILQKSNSSIFLDYDKLSIPQSERKLFNAKLKNTKLVTVQESKMVPTYEINPEGLIILHKYGSYSNYIIHAEKQQTIQRNKDEERENLELQKLRFENKKLQDYLVEFPKIKLQRNWLFIFAIVELLAILTGIVLQLIEKS